MQKEGERRVEALWGNLPTMLLKHAGFTMQATHVAYVWNAFVLV